MSSNFASPTMLQSVTCLSFSVFGGSLKIEFGKLQSMFNFCFSAKTLQSLTELPKREGEVSILTVIFLSLAPSPQIHFPPCAERFFSALPPHPSPPTLHFSGKEEAGNSRLPRSYFSKHERLQCWVHKGSCNNSKKNTVRGELISKRKISQQERP